MANTFGYSTPVGIYIAVFDTENHKIVQNIELQELSNDPVTTLVVDYTTGLIAAAYSNGLIAYLCRGVGAGQADQATA